MRRVSTRTLVAVMLFVISATASLTVFVQYRTAQEALRQARAAQVAGRGLRVRTDLQFCRAINQGRAINNRDRETLVRAREQAVRDLRGLKDPVLRHLLAKSLAQTRREINVRPLLRPLRCHKIVVAPLKKLAQQTKD